MPTTEETLPIERTERTTAQSERQKRRRVTLADGVLRLGQPIMRDDYRCAIYRHAMAGKITYACAACRDSVTLDIDVDRDPLLQFGNEHADCIPPWLYAIHPRDDIRRMESPEHVGDIYRWSCPACDGECTEHAEAERDSDACKESRRQIAADARCYSCRKRSEDRIGFDDAERDMLVRWRGRPRRVSMKHVSEKTRFSGDNDYLQLEDLPELDNHGRDLGAGDQKYRREPSLYRLYRHVVDGSEPIERLARRPLAWALLLVCLLTGAGCSSRRPSASIASTGNVATHTVSSLKLTASSAAGTSVGADLSVARLTETGGINR